MTERRNTIELRSDGKRLIGYAATFNTPSHDLGGFIETIAPGAFTRSLSEMPDVLALWDHDRRSVLGRTTSGTLKLSEDARGLRFEIETPNTSTGRDVLEMVGRGDVEGDIAKFEKAYPSGTKERLALALLLYTAARGSDVARLGPQHIANNKIKIRAQKTKQTVLLPVHPALQAELNQHKIQHLTFLVTEYGKPYSIKGFQQWFSKKSRKAGLLPIKCDDGRVRGCTAHGLRKAAATRLADAGCTDREIMAVTGHKTTKEVSRYTESRDQTLAAEKAFKLLKIDRGNG